MALSTKTRSLPEAPRNSPTAAAASIAYVTTGPITKDTGVYLTLVPSDNQAAAIPVINPGNLYQGPLTPNGP